MKWNASDDALGIRMTVWIDPPQALHLPSQVVGKLTQDSGNLIDTLLGLLQILIYLENRGELTVPYEKAWKDQRSLDQDSMIEVVKTLAGQLLVEDEAKSFMTILKMRLKVMPTSDEEDEPPSTDDPSPTPNTLTQTASILMAEPLYEGEAIECGRCDGEGNILKYGSELPNVKQACPNCHGKGYWILTKIDLTQTST